MYTLCLKVDLLDYKCNWDVRKQLNSILWMVINKMSYILLMINNSTEIKAADNDCQSHCKRLQNYILWATIEIVSVLFYSVSKGLAKKESVRRQINSF